MENWKTSLAGIITGVLGILGAFHVGAPSIVSDNVGLIAAVGATIVGILAKDGGASRRM